MCLDANVRAKMQKRIGCSDEDMGFWFGALALQCTRVYVKYHMDDLDELQEYCATHPIIGLSFGVVQNGVQKTFQEANMTAYENAELIADAIIKQLNAIGTQAYEAYGLIIPKGGFFVSDAKKENLITFLNTWSLNRTKKKEEINTLFELIICVFYYLLQEIDNGNCDMKVNMIMMYARSVASFSDYFWTGKSTESDREECIKNMPVSDFVERIDKLFSDTMFINEVLGNYLDMVEHGHEGHLL